MLVGRILTVLATAFVCYCNGDQESCLRFGGGSCCPVVEPIDRTIQEIAEIQPVYAVFFPNNSDSYNVDNVCFTFFPAPDDSSTYITYLSRVYCDGSVDVKSFMLTEVETGVRRFGSSLCQFTDTEFAELDCDSEVFLLQRCLTYGACSDASLVGSSGVFGLSETRRPISKACLNKAKSTISYNGLPVDDYFVLPMRLASRCVLNQVCTVASNLQRFCQTVGIAFPAVNNNNCANQYY